MNDPPKGPTMHGHALSFGLLAVLLIAAGCSSSASDTTLDATTASTPPTPTTSVTPSPSATPTVAPTPTVQPTTSIVVDPAPAPSASTKGPTSEEPAAEATIVRFTSGDTTIDLTIGADNPTIRDFLSMLPLTLPVEEFNGREKISYLPRELDTDGSPGSDPEDGDLIYYSPWGNLGFYYNTDGVGYSDDVIHLGTYDATLDELTLLEGADVTIEIVQ